MTSPGRRRVIVVVRGLDPVGSGRQAELAAEALRAAGHDVVVAATTGGGSVPERLARAGFAVHRLSRRPRPGPEAAAALGRLARRGGPATLLAFGRAQAAAAVAARALGPGTTVAAAVELPPRGFAGVLAARADRLILPDEACAAAWRRGGADAARIDLVPPGIEPVGGTGASRGEVAARLGLRPDTVWTLCVAPLDPCAHLDRLLWAVDQLGVVHRGLEHVLVGAGPLVGRVRRRARLQRLAERLFVHASADCLPDLLPRVRLVWQAGEVAGGGCLLDGMAHGVAAVAVDASPSRRLIVDGVTGRLVAADPISELPRRALAIIEDDALAARYGSAARDRAARDFPLPAFAAGIVAAVSRAG